MGVWFSFCEVGIYLIEYIFKREIILFFSNKFLKNYICYINIRNIKEFLFIFDDILVSGRVRMLELFL